MDVLCLAEAQMVLADRESPSTAVGGEERLVGSQAGSQLWCRTYKDTPTAFPREPAENQRRSTGAGVPPHPRWAGPSKRPGDTASGTFTAHFLATRGQCAEVLPAGRPLPPSLAHQACRAGGPVPLANSLPQRHPGSWTVRSCPG